MTSFFHAYVNIATVNNKKYYMFGIGQPELIIIIFILLLFFGPTRLPKLSKTLGESARALKDGFTDGKNCKTLKDIAKEVSSAAQEIKQGITKVKINTSVNEDS